VCDTQQPSKRRASDKLNKNYFARGFSSISDLSPSYVSGFSVGEYSFHVSVLKNKCYKIGFQVLPVFTTQLHIKDLSLLLKSNLFFWCWSYYQEKYSRICYILSSIFKEINDVIVPHF